MGTMVLDNVDVHAPYAVLGVYRIYSEASGSFNSAIDLSAVWPVSLAPSQVPDCPA